MLRELDPVTRPETASPDEIMPHLMPGIISEVLETMFFTEAEPAACEHGWLPSAPCVRVRFEGSHRGQLLLALSQDAADPVAAGFLGLEPLELTEMLRAQVLEELANIVCGALLSHLWPDSKLALASPELAAWEEWPAQGAPAGPQPAFAGNLFHRCFLLPEGKLAVSLRLTRSIEVSGSL